MLVGDFLGGVVSANISKLRMHGDHGGLDLRGLGARRATKRRSCSSLVHMMDT